MTIKTGQAWAGLFVTLDATGAASAADSTPTGTLYVDGVSDAATVTITGSNPYKFAVTLPTLTAGQRVDMYIAATIDTIATAGIVASAQADTVLLSDGVTLADDAITAAKFDESTAFPLKSADSGATAIARTGADSDTLETLSDQMDLTALEATLTAIKGAGWTNETLVAIKVLIDAIKAKTDGLDISAVNFVTVVNGTTITIMRGDTLDDGTLTDLGDLTDYVSIDFIVKAAYSKTDDEAVIHIRKNASGTDDGLLRLNEVAHTTNTDGWITIDDLITGDITPNLKATVTDDLVPGNYVYDVQVIKANSVKTKTYGKLIVSADVTRLVA